MAAPPAQNQQVAWHHLIYPSLSARLPPRRTNILDWRQGEVFQRGVDLGGSFRGVPLELVHQIFHQLDITSLANLACTSQGMRRAVGSLPKLQALVEHAPDTMRAVMASKSGPNIICNDIYEQLIRPNCSLCNRAGIRFHVLSCTRVCRECLLATARLRGLRPKQVAAQFDLPLSAVMRLPFLKVPRYSSEYRAWCSTRRRQVRINTTGWRLIDMRDVHWLCRRIHGSTDTARRRGIDNFAALTGLAVNLSVFTVWQRMHMRTRRARALGFRHVPPPPTGALRFHIVPDYESAQSVTTGLPYLDLDAQKSGDPILCVACHEANEPLKRCYYSSSTIEEHKRHCRQVQTEDI